MTIAKPKSSRNSSLGMPQSERAREPCHDYSSHELHYCYYYHHYDAQSLPPSSLSVESFVVCKNYQPPSGYEPTMIDPLLDLHYGMSNPSLGSNRVLVPFLACGDLSGFDSDQNYPLEVLARNRSRSL